MAITDLINIRELRKEDLNFILDSSISCLSKYTESIFKGWTYKNTVKHLEQLILYTLNKENYSTFIACLREDENSIISYVVADVNENKILFQYTKYNFRKLGIQKLILLPLVLDFDANNMPITVQWPTKEMLKLAKQQKIEIRDCLTEALLKERISHEN